MAKKLSHTHPRDCSLASPPCQRALIPQTLSAGELYCQEWWSNAFACVMPSHHSFNFPPKQTKAEDEKPQHPTYARPSEKSVIDHMLGILHTIQHAEPVTLKMSHSPQLWVTLCHLSWYFSGQLIHFYYK